MKTVKKNIRAILLAAVCCLLVLRPLSVRAELDETTSETLKQQISIFLERAFQMTDEQLDGMAQEGGFYEVFCTSWKEDRNTVGEVVEIHDPVIDESDPAEIRTETVVDFRNYTADISMTFTPKEFMPKNYVMNIRYSMKEKMTQAAQNMAVGLIVVFAVLLFLMLVIYLFRFIPSDGISLKKKKPETAASGAAPAGLSETPEEDAARYPGASDEEEIAAVIAAAIAAAEEEAPSASGYTVRSVRRKQSAWKRA